MKQQETVNRAPVEKILTFSDFDSQGSAMRGLHRTLREGTYVHAYLLSGAAGVGKKSLMRVISSTLLCTCETEKPCGKCPGCVQYYDGTHPDVIRIRPGKGINSDRDTERGKDAIVVDTIRQMVQMVGEHTYTGGVRIVEILEAEKMNPPAQNALLKTLEEPPDNTVFMLVTEKTNLLLPTIISRCRHIPLHPWDNALIDRILREQGVGEERRGQTIGVCNGSIGVALQMAFDEEYWQRREKILDQFLNLRRRSDIFSVAAFWKDQKEEIDGLLTTVNELLRQVWLVNFGLLPENTLAGYDAAWRHMAREARGEDFTQMIGFVDKARQQRLNQVTPQAVLEQLMLNIMGVKTKWST